MNNSTGMALASVTASVTFGMPQAGGGPCVSKGVCKMDSNNPQMTQVKFSLSEDLTGLLLLTFSLSELKVIQPDQLVYFMDPSGHYPFDADYKLTDPILGALKFEPNPWVSTTSPTKVFILGDLVALFIQYEHD